MHGVLVALLIAAPPVELDADPDAAATGLAWRAGTRAVLAANLRLVTPDETGFVLRVPGLVELNNDYQDQPLPWESWRARVSVALGWRFDARLTLLAVAEHESDHASDGGAVYSDYLNLNSVALRAESDLALAERDMLFAVVTLRLHVLTCTNDTEACSDDVGLGGSRTFELAGGATWTHTLTETWDLFASVHGALLARAARVSPERRLVMRAGLGLDAGDAGRFGFFAETLLGNPVGIARSETVHVLGVGLRWAP